MIANLNLDDCNFLLREVLILLLNSQGDCGQFEISMWMKEHHIKNKNHHDFKILKWYSFEL